MNVTLTANGYQGQKAEVVEIREAGALVSIFRKGVDLAARVIYFTWDAIKRGKRKMPQAPQPQVFCTPHNGIKYHILAESTVTRYFGEMHHALCSKNIVTNIGDATSDADAIPGYAHVCARCTAKLG